MKILSAASHTYENDELVRRLTQEINEVLSKYVAVKKNCRWRTRGDLKSAMRRNVVKG